MLESRTRAKVVIAGGAVTLLVAVFAGNAFANTVSFGGNVSGQASVIVSFELHGTRCPRGPHCFDHAKVTGFGAANFSYPNCPDLAEGAFIFGNPNTGKPGVRVDKHDSFNGNGRDYVDPVLRVSFHGRFVKRGAEAQGWFEVDNAGCTTGRLNWTATPER
jgi:hypothetical protein